MLAPDPTQHSSSDLSSVSGILAGPAATSEIEIAEPVVADTPDFNTLCEHLNVLTCHMYPEITLGESKALVPQEGTEQFQEEDYNTSADQKNPIYTPLLHRQKPDQYWAPEHPDILFNSEGWTTPSQTLFDTLSGSQKPYPLVIFDALNKLPIKIVDITNDKSIQIQLTEGTEKSWIPITWKRLSPEYQDLFLESLEHRSNPRTYTIFLTLLCIAAGMALLPLVATTTPEVLYIIYGIIGSGLLLSISYNSEQQPSSFQFKLINTALLLTLLGSTFVTIHGHLLIPFTTMALIISAACIIVTNTILFAYQYYKNQNIKQNILTLKANTSRNKIDLKPEYFYTHNTQNTSYSNHVNDQIFPFPRLKIIMSQQNPRLSNIRKALEELNLTIQNNAQDQLIVMIDGLGYASEHVTLEWAHVHSEYRNIFIDIFKSKTCHKLDYLPFILSAIAGASIPLCISYQTTFTVALASHTPLFLGIMIGLGLLSFISIFRHQSKYAKRLQGLNMFILGLATWIGYSALSIPLPILTIVGAVFAGINVCHCLGLGIYDRFSGMPNKVARLQMPHLDPELAADTQPTTTIDATAQAAHAAQAAHVNPLRASQDITDMDTQPDDDAAKSYEISETTHVAPPNGADLEEDITEMMDTNDRRQPE